LLRGGRDAFSYQREIEREKKGEINKDNLVVLVV
jgi:hypothetical protein